MNNKLDSIFLKYDKEKFGLYSNPTFGVSLDTHELVLAAEVIYIHWVMMGFFNINSLSELFATGKKIFIVMHDMWFMTGGCHYTFDCDGFKSDCGGCPIFADASSPAKSQLLRKHSLYGEHSNLTFISPSRWMKNLGFASTLLRDKPIYFIPNYFNSSIFKPKDIKQSRAELAIALEKKVICFGAVQIQSPYKGWSYLKKAMDHLTGFYSYEELEIIVFGSVDEDLVSESLKFKVHFLGYLDSEERIAQAYTASDVFVLPSVMDNQPTTVIESLNCGIPVVAFDLGGTPEMIDHLGNGYLAKPYDAKDLANGIHYCLSSPMKVYLKEDYHPDRVLDRHASLMNSEITGDE